MAFVFFVIAASIFDHVDIEGFGVDVHEHRHGADIGDRFGRGDKGKGRRDDLVSAPDARGKERQVQGVRARGDRHGMLDAVVRRDLCFERLSLGSEDEVGAFHDAQDGPRNFLF